MNDLVIKVEDLWKEYTVGTSRKNHTTFYDLLGHALKAPIDRFRNRGGTTPEACEFWALRDVNFEVRSGEVLGVIGRNGAGKSTLLKILSRITAPTKGRIEVNGRLTSLLEVGTGFHPELTGRENIFLNGAILGMTRREVARKFDEIVEFAEINKFVDTPVKRYSSGMYIRLAFSVAASLDADVLVVDEVLAVGDMEFQKKCLGRMHDVVGGGRTVIFVSHNMASIKALCTRAILLNEGRQIADGPAAQIVDKYISNVEGKGANLFAFGSADHRVRSAISIESIELLKPPSRDVFLYGEPVTLRLAVRCAQAVPDVRFGIALISEGQRIFTLNSDEYSFEPSECSSLTCRIPAGTLLPGHYSLILGAHRVRTGAELDWVTREIPLAVSEIAADISDPVPAKSWGVVLVPSEWNRAL
jgi:lipopolysaccharide transport system ATP-binding protein